jgi:host factor-I protein
VTKTQLNLQDVFLNQVRKENIPVTIYLVNSVQLRGHVRGFDAFTIMLDSQGRPTQLVYKHAVTSIVPARPVSQHPEAPHRPRYEQSAEQPSEERSAESPESAEV